MFCTMYIKSPQKKESLVTKHFQESMGSGEDLGEVGSGEEGWWKLGGEEGCPEWPAAPLFC